MIHKEGKYVVIEGTDGTGKSTQVEMLADRLQERSIETVQFHEPDGVEIASEIRSVIKNGNLARSAFTNVLYSRLHEEKPGFRKAYRYFNGEGGFYQHEITPQHLYTKGCRKGLSSAKQLKKI